MGADQSVGSGRAFAWPEAPARFVLRPRDSHQANRFYDVDIGHHAHLYKLIQARQPPSCADQKWKTDATRPTMGDNTCVCVCVQVDASVGLRWPQAENAR